MYSAEFPAKITIHAPEICICRSKCGRQAANSSSEGFLFPGGRQFTVFSTNTWERESPASFRLSFRSRPAFPLNGTPVASSLAPGASPTNAISDPGVPSHGTAFCRLRWSGQRVQVLMAWRAFLALYLATRARRLSPVTSLMKPSCDPSMGPVDLVLAILAHVIDRS